MSKIAIDLPSSVETLITSRIDRLDVARLLAPIRSIHPSLAGTLQIMCTLHTFTAAHPVAWRDVERSNARGKGWVVARRDHTSMEPGVGCCE